MPPTTTRRRAPRFKRAPTRGIATPKPQSPGDASAATQGPRYDLAICRALLEHNVLNSKQLALRVSPDAEPCKLCEAAGTVTPHLLAAVRQFRAARNLRAHEFELVIASRTIAAAIAYLPLVEPNPERIVCPRCTGIGREHAAKIVKRAGHLFQHGFLERPHNQLVFDYQPGSRRNVFRLAPLGAQLLRAHNIDVPPGTSYRKVTREFLAHKIAVQEFRTELAATLHAYSHITFIEKPALLADINSWRSTHTPPLPEIKIIKFHRKAPFPGFNEPQLFRAVADDVFRLSQANKRFHYFLEQDMGQEPLTRSDPSLFGHSSILGKLLAYDAGYTANDHHRTWGWSEFRVLFLAPDPTRARGILETIREPRVKNKKLFHVSDVETLAETRRHSNILEHPWLDHLGGVHRLAAL